MNWKAIAEIKASLANSFGEYILGRITRAEWHERRDEGMSIIADLTQAASNR